MNNWFECKVAYEKQDDNVGMKKVTELYLVDAMSFTEAEERIIDEVKPFVQIGELEVVNIKRQRLSELFLSDRDSDRLYYKARVNYVTIDEKSGMEKKTGVNILIQAEKLADAVKILTSKMEEGMSDYEIASISETAILDVVKHG